MPVIVGDGSGDSKMQGDGKGVSVGSTDTTGRNAGVSTATGTLILFNETILGHYGRLCRFIRTIKDNTEWMGKHIRQIHQLLQLVDATKWVKIQKPCGNW